MKHSPSSLMLSIQNTGTVGRLNWSAGIFSLAAMTQSQPDRPLFIEEADGLCCVKEVLHGKCHRDIVCMHWMVTIVSFFTFKMKNTTIP